mmetsp:Transcript_89/g.138  ORF Transcript_89/g.138 Transcript_89/m.138 type:complete len:328 (-) Transcript_89:146-1129(-)
MCMYIAPMLNSISLCCMFYPSGKSKTIFANMENERPEVLYEWAAAAPPKRKKRRKKMKRQKRISQLDQKNRSDDISDDDLAHHVSSMYITGPGGMLNDAAKKRERFEEFTSSFDQDHTDVLKKLDKHPALVLNADYQPLSVLPLSIWSWQETIKGVFSGKVVVVDVYPGLCVRAVNMDLPLPSVIALTDYVKQPNQAPNFTRRNVFLRDGYKCQYCTKKFVTRDLSLDHVLPRCKGGKLNWMNTVASCTKCNGKKGSTLPTDLKRIGMKLAREPRVPSKWELASNSEKLVPKNVHRTWRPFLGMNMIPENIGGDSESFLDESSSLEF